MATIDDITQRVRDALKDRPGLSKSVKLDFKGEGFIHVDGQTVTNDDAPADCIVVVSRDDLEAMVRGELDPMSAMLRGRLRIKGDMAVAMQLQSMLRGRG